ncbi:MAG: hypothetical protein AB7E95_11275 [Kiritimatiellales bacterium]
MRKLLLLASLCCALGVLAAEKPLTVSTTIDFLDYVFYDMPKGSSVYPLEHYEKRIAEMAAGGIDRIYLRVNVCGLTLYPSKVCTRYGDRGRFHDKQQYPGQVDNLIQTLNAYDPLRETIRLGKKYNLEVWAWENLWDDAATVVTASGKVDPTTGKSIDFPLIDPFFEDFPQGYAMRRVLPADEIAAARNRTIGALEIVSDQPRNFPARVTAEKLRILTSENNRAYTPYAEPFVLKTEKLPDGRWKLTVSGLKIKAPYIKLAFVSPQPKDEKYVFVFAAPGLDQCRIFDTAGARIPAEMGYCLENRKEAENSALLFNTIGNWAWDHQNRQLGFALGGSDDGKYLLGFAEFAVPKTMRHKVARFEELTKYNFDGFMFNLRSHSPAGSNYGFNPELRELYLKRYGKDILKDSFDRKKLNELRADAIDEFLSNCKKLTGGRPLYFSAISNERPTTNTATAAWNYGVPFHYAKWFAESSVDGVVMINGDFRAEIQKAAAGKPISIGVFREMAFGPKGYNFESDLMAIGADHGIAEVELYETLVLNKTPAKFETIKKAKALRTDKP